MKRSSSDHHTGDTHAPHHPRRRTVLGGALAGVLGWLGLRRARPESVSRTPTAAAPASAPRRDDDDGPIWLGHL